MDWSLSSARLRLESLRPPSPVAPPGGLGSCSCGETDVRDDTMGGRVDAGFDTRLEKMTQNPITIGRVSVSRYMARLRATEADWGTGYKNNILMMDDSCSFRLMNTRKIRS